MKQRAFTLLELLIVIIILGILASIAMPRYLSSIEKSRDAEAYVHLSTIRIAELDYYAEFHTYTNNFDLLNVDNPNNLEKPPVGTRLFDYSIEAEAPTNTFTAIASRQAGDTQHTITIDHHGRVNRVVTGP